MDQSAPYQHHPRPAQLFPQGGQLPPPSALHLPMPSFSRSNTLPPIPAMSHAPDARYPPPSYHPSLATPTSSAGGPLTSPASAGAPPWSASGHRTSSSRDEVHPGMRRRESKGKAIDGPGPSDSHREPQQGSSRHHQQQHQQLAPAQQDMQKDTDDGLSSTSDFVKKLYKMLEDSAFANVVSWNQAGDAFVVKDMNEFTKSILPRMFKHSNFASFVRQLNKYDFHKVKNSDDSQFGEHSWTFRHPDFQIDRRDALENIKRKVPAQRKSAVSSRGQAGSPGVSPSDGVDNPAAQALQAQIDRLTQAHDEMTQHIRHLESNYQSVLGEMVNFQRNMAQQDGLMQNLIQYFLQLENAKIKEEQNASNANGSANNGGGTFADQNPFVAAREAQRMVGNYPEDDVARASLEQLNEISRRATAAGMTFTNGAVSAGSNRPVTPGSAQRILAAAAGMLQGHAQPQDAQRQSPQAQNRATPSSAGPALTNLSREDALQRIEELARQRPASAGGRGGGMSQAGAPQQQILPSVQYASGSDPFIMPGPESGALDLYAGGGGSPTSITHSGLQVFTLGHLMPKSTGDDDSAIWSFDATQHQGGGASAAASAQAAAYGSASANGAPPAGMGGGADYDASVDGGAVSRPGSAQKLRVRRSTFVPGWAVPPRVLLVDDDAVSRKLSSKFLQVFGCTIDVAVDGVVAVNKMNLEKYDLVLMDIVMPKLDGVSATSLIRQFDHMTPIISMTSNSKPNEIMTYYNHGMNDILPKPFTKEGLLSMLEKHLTHLKTIQQLSRVPRSVGIPPLSDSQFDQALMVTAANPPPPDDDGGKINPLAGMGLSDEEYAAILQGIVNGETFQGLSPNFNLVEKRSLDDAADGRDGKRGRFEVIE
ncbi:HSF-type DNA-binding-domain-containing protein [Phellopilus nigrolimitatus]|nr:HSF-type DNA-binding-domain-containing protein [Phellopilus nigrolimitatus]